jgi:hypothetical protein
MHQDKPQDLNTKRNKHLKYMNLSTAEPTDALRDLPHSTQSVQLGLKLIQG